MPHLKPTEILDLAIIGGGINGSGCAAEASLRGLSVVLCERGDLGSQTSSASSKLIHGGLRYLEQCDFLLVKHALDERQRLLNLAPYLVKPLKFIIPQTPSTRPSWLIRLGLFIYDYLSFKNQLPHHQTLTRLKYPNDFLPLKAAYQKGFSYYDAHTEDSRLVLVNALQAKKHGATILTQTEVINIEAHQNFWELTLRSKDNQTQTIRAKALINAAGACVQHINQLAGLPARYQTTLIQGTHIIVPRWYSGEQAYLLQHLDKRVIFVIPYQTDYTLIGTTETTFTGDPLAIQAQPSEVDYLLQTIQHFFNHALCKKDILHVTSGVRTLVSQAKNPRQMSRDWAYDYAVTPLPYVSIYSGKLTTYRKLSEIVLAHLAPHFPNIQPSATAHTPLPGSTYENLSFDEYKAYAEKKYAWLAAETRQRYLYTYGTRTEDFLRHAASTEDLGVAFGPTVYQIEIDYLIREEWVTHIEDILWRRTKIGLTLSRENIERLKSHYQDKIVF